MLECEVVFKSTLPKEKKNKNLNLDQQLSMKAITQTNRLKMKGAPWLPKSIALDLNS